MSGETSDDYARIVWADGNHRIIRCRSDLQWIIQRRERGNASRPWRATAFVVNPRNLRNFAPLPDEVLAPLLKKRG